MHESNVCNVLQGPASKARLRYDTIFATQTIEGESQRNESVQYILSAVDSTCEQQCTKDTRMFLTKL